MKLSIPKEDPYYLSEDNVGFDSYLAGASAIGLKSLNGNIISVRFREPIIKKYFRVRFMMSMINCIFLYQNQCMVKK